MSTALIVLCTLAGLLTGVLFGALITQLRGARRIEALRVELASAQVRLESSSLQEADRLSLLEQSETRLRAAFDSLAGETLRMNSELFLRSVSPARESNAARNRVSDCSSRLNRSASCSELDSSRT